MATERPRAMGYRQLGNAVSNSKRQNRCVFSGLSEDLLVEVLLRLPFKSFIQFQLVSKHWHSLISSLMCSVQKPWAFVYLTPTIHRQEKMRKLEFLTSSASHNYENPIFKANLPFLPKDLQQQQQQQPWVSIEASFKDLILCRAHIPRSSTYYICNPLTKQYMVLPPPPTSDRFYRPCCFICEPYTKHDKNNNIQHSRLSEISSDFRFRVVLAYYVNRLEIYSSETGLWTTNNLSCPSGLCSAFVQKFVASCGQILTVIESDECHGSSAIMFDPFKATRRRTIQGRSAPSDHFDKAMEVFPCQDRILLCRTLIIDGQPDPKLTVWELGVGALAKDSNHDNDPWRLIHQVAICDMKGGTTDEDNLNDWRKEVYVSEANPYSWKYKRSWIANFLKSALAHPYLYPDPYPPFVVKYDFMVSCVGFHPLDINVMFLLLSFRCTGDHHTSCLAMYDMRTKAINAVPEEQMPVIFCRFKLFCTLLTDSSQSLFPIVAQPKRTLI